MNIEREVLVSGTVRTRTLTSLLFFLSACCSTEHHSWCSRLTVFEVTVESNISDCKTSDCVNWNRERLDLLEKACAEERRREHE